MYVPYTSHGCTLYMGNVCIGGAFEVSTTGIQVTLCMYCVAKGTAVNNSTSKVSIIMYMYKLMDSQGVKCVNNVLIYIVLLCNSHGYCSF